MSLYICLAPQIKNIDVEVFSIQWNIRFEKVDSGSMVPVMLHTRDTSVCILISEAALESD